MVIERHILPSQAFRWRSLASNSGCSTASLAVLRASTLVSRSPLPERISSSLACQEKPKQSETITRPHEWFCWLLHVAAVSQPTFLSSTPLMASWISCCLSRKPSLVISAIFSRLSFSLRPRSLLNTRNV